MQFNYNRPISLAVHRLLKPIVRFALSRSLAIQEIYDILRAVVIDVAVEDIEKRKGKINASRLSVATGLPRKDVTNILERVGTSTTEPSSLLGRVVGQWEQDRKYRDKKGKPRMLTFGTDDSEFSKLVRQVSAHVGARAVLEQLERNGTVATIDNRLRLVKTTMDFSADESEAVKILAKDFTDMIATMEYNRGLPDQTAQNVHFRTQYDNIYISAVPEIRDWLKNEARALHKRIREFLSQHDKDVNPSDQFGAASGARIGMTTFSYSEIPAELEESAEVKVDVAS